MVFLSIYNMDFTRRITIITSNENAEQFKTDFSQEETFSTTKCIQICGLLDSREHQELEFSFKRDNIGAVEIGEMK